MAGLWIGFGVAISVIAVLREIWSRVETTKARRRHTIRQRQLDAEAAMAQVVQNTLAEMFEAVRRQPDA